MEEQKDWQEISANSGLWIEHISIKKVKVRWRSRAREYRLRTRVSNPVRSEPEEAVQ